MSAQQWPWAPSSTPFPITWVDAANPESSRKWALEVPDLQRRKAAKRMMELLVKQTGAECEFLESARVRAGLHDTTTDESGYAKQDLPHLTVDLKHAGYSKPLTAHIYIVNSQWMGRRNTNYGSLTRTRVTVVTQTDGRYPNHVLNQHWAGWSVWRPGMSPTLPSQVPQQGGGNGGNGAGGPGGGDGTGFVQSQGGGGMMLSSPSNTPGAGTGGGYQGTTTTSRGGHTYRQASGGRVSCAPDSRGNLHDSPTVRRNGVKHHTSASTKVSSHTRESVPHQRGNHPISSKKSSSTVPRGIENKPRPLDPHGQQKAPKKHWWNSG